MRILVASVTNKGPEILGPHIRSVLAQDLPPRVKVDLAYISDGLSEEALDILSEAGASVADALPKPDDATYAVTEETHEWNLPTFGWLAREKQRLLDHAKDGRYDGIFFVDSDLVLGPETLASLIHAQKDVVSAVFWTRWQKDAPLMPQVWLRHPYEMSGRGLRADEFLRSLGEKGLVRVGGLGACTLIRERVFDRVRWFPLVDGLPSGGMWQGEDRHFCVHAARGHVEMWADAWPDIFHIYRPSDLPRLQGWLEGLPPRPEKPSRGAWVSFTVEAVEEKDLHGHREYVRGRVGNLEVLPEIEETILSMKVGETRVVEAEFPAWSRVEAYRGRKRHLLLRLLDVKVAKDEA